MTSPLSLQRLAVVIPSVNTVVESWFPTVLPGTVRLAVNRMLIGSEVTRETLSEMDERGIEAARVLATCQPSVLLYGCTASSLVGGREYDLALMRQLTDASGVPALTTTESVLRALAHLQVGAVAVASPYTDEIGEAEVDFLASNGHPVVGHAHLGIANGFDLARPDATEIRELALTAWNRAEGRADALFIGCMNLASHDAVADLEGTIGAPVVTATTASVWATLRQINTEPSTLIPGALVTRHLSQTRRP